MVDDEDFKFLSRWSWYASVEEYTTYPKRSIGHQGKIFTVAMASVVMGLPSAIEIDHKDGNGLNAQKYNLRIATRSQQTANQKLSCRNTSGFKGVVKYGGGPKWLAKIKKDGQWWNLGTFENPRDAASAYDAKAIELYGEFAKTNKMMGLI